MKSLLLLFLTVVGAFAQGKVTATMQNFQANVEPQGRRTFITGTNAVPKGNGITLITLPHVETFKIDGSRDMIIDAEEAYFDQAKGNDVWSEKALSTRKADGQIAVKGVGFRWQQAQAQLAISNKVEAIIHREIVATAPASTNLLRVTSEQMTYTSELVTFTGKVHVTDAQGEVFCEILKVHFHQNNTPRQIEALGGVMLTQKDTVARGQRAVYTYATGLLRLAEKTTWKMADRHGESDLLIIDRTNNTFRAESNVRMTLPSSGLVNTNSTPAGTNFLTIRADTFDYAPTNRITGGAIAIYNGNVRAVDPQANLDCELLTIYFNQSNRVARAVADRAVQITRPATSVRGDRAVFENDEITVTGQPVWRHAEKSGTSEMIVFNPQTSDIRALHVRMEIPFTSGTNSLFGTAPIAANQPATVITNILLVTSKYFTNKEKLATFSENVRAIEPRGQIDANFVSVQFNATNRPVRIFADGDVILTETKSQALGQQAEFNVETGLVRLMGRPKVMDGTNFIMAREILFNRNTGRVKYLPPFLGELTQGANQSGR